MTKVLLLTCPDIYQHWDKRFIVGPWLGGPLIAGNCLNYEIKVADLVLWRHDVKKGIDLAMKNFKPDIVGVSAMTFQYPTAKKIGEYLKSHYMKIPTILGGYHVTASTKEEVVAEVDGIFDFLYAGLAEFSFESFLNAFSNFDLEKMYSIPGLSFKANGGWIHNKISTECPSLEESALPKRDSRLYKGGFHFIGKNFDTIETSKGCNMNCIFCSIKKMITNYAHRPIPWVIEDLKKMKAKRVKSVFLTDDNPAVDDERFERLLQSIIAQKLNEDMCFSGTFSTLKMSNPKTVELMKKANFWLTFLGVESIEPSILKAQKKASSEHSAQKALENLYDAGIISLTGIVIGNPNDTKETIKNLYRFLRESPASYVMPQFLQPYPGTVMREELLAKDLVCNISDWSTYNGAFCQCKTLSGLLPYQIESITLEEQNNFVIERVKSFSKIKNFVKANPLHMAKWILTETPKLFQNIGKTSEEKAKISRQKMIQMNQFNI